MKPPGFPEAISGGLCGHIEVLDGGFLGGPLMGVHAVHHLQHNPCRQGASYIHPIEEAMGLGLYAASIFMLSHVMRPFHVATIIVTWVAFSQINLHNHARFTGGNFATITLFSDWMFGPLDRGSGYGRNAKANQSGPAVAGTDNVVSERSL